MSCCDYHTDTDNSIRNVFFPVFIRFKTKTGKHVDAIYEKVYGSVRFDDGKICNRLSNATLHAYRICNEKLPRNYDSMRDIDLWYVYINGHDVMLSQIRRLTNRLQNIEFKQMNCVMINDSLHSTDKDSDTRNEIYSKVVLKFNQNKKNESLKRTKQIIATKRSIQKTEENFLENDDDEDEFDWTPDQEIWTVEDFHEFIGRYPNEAPKLIKINNKYYSNSFPKHRCNAIYECTFVNSKNEQKILDVASSLLHHIPQYKKVVEKYIEK
tara:strand:+ start:90 stop:893 length:804 start_codon:yes stop_codon:yes gene_type:complete